MQVQRDDMLDQCNGMIDWGDDMLEQRDVILDPRVDSSGLGNLIS